jgi:hypothetical protein
MKRFILSSLLTLLGVVFLLASPVSATGLKTIHVMGGLDQSLPTCGEGQTPYAYFVINQLDKPSDAPPSITVDFKNGAVSWFSLLTVNGPVAKYQGIAPGPVTDAIALIYPAWHGRFNLSHYFCGPGSTPPPSTTTTVPCPHPTTTTLPPATTTLPPVTTTLPPVTTTLPPVTTTVPSPTTTVPGTTLPPPVTTVPPVTTTKPPAAPPTTVAPTTTVNAPVPVGLTAPPTTLAVTGARYVWQLVFTALAALLFGVALIVLSRTIRKTP